MLAKIYLGLTALFFLVISFLGYYSWSWLQSIDKPQTVIENFNSWSGYFTTFLWLSSLILLIIANILLWTRRSSRALWTTLGYFVLFILFNGFILENAAIDYKKANNFSDSTLPFGAILSIILCIAAAVLIFFNQFVILRLQERMYPVKELTPVLSEEPELSAEKKIEHQVD